MNCTQCKTSVMEPRELESGLIAAVCPTCEGALVSLMNYRYWVDRHETLAHSLNNSEVVSVSEIESAHSCPKCRRLMTKYQIGPNSNSKLDLCVSCDEAWLDKGEWQLLKRLDLQDKLPKIFTDAWQHNIRKTRQEAALNERYEKLLGTESFTKSKEFKTWLYQQPNKESIKQYLISLPE